MRKDSTYLIILIIFTFAFILSIPSYQNVLGENSDNPIEVYAVLFDQFPQEINGTIMCSAIEISDTLLCLGWSSENISIFLGEENMTKNIFLEQLNYLEDNVDENDLVFIYLSAHGHIYCRDVLDFNSWFQIEFNQIGTDNKIFLMESCYSGEFVELFFARSFALSSVAKDEIALLFVPEDNDTWLLSEPIFAGGISSHFWAKTLTDINADSSGNGVVSLEEMYGYSLPYIKQCYNETFEIYPEIADYASYVAGSTENYPHPKVMNNLPYEVTLNATDFILNNQEYLWEEDQDGPIIDVQNIILFTENDEEIEIIFVISDRSDFDYYCYVNDVLEKWGSHETTESNSWNFRYTLSVEPNNEYNVSLSAVDVWGNVNLNSTLVTYDPETETAPYNSVFTVFAIFILPITTLLLRAKKRKD